MLQLFQTQQPTAKPHPNVEDFVKLQQRLERSINPIARKPLVDGLLLPDIVLAPFVDNIIEHDLGRKLEGYAIARREFVPSKFLAYRNAAGTLATGTTTVDYDAESYDDGSRFDLTTNGYSTPVYGLYGFIWSVQVTAATDGDRINAFLQVDGATQIGLRGSNDVVGAAGKTSRGFGYAETRLEASKLVTVALQHDDAGALAYNTVGATSGTIFAGGLVDEGITDRQAANATPDKTLVLRCSYTQTVSLWVY